jgi:CxxC motif-containing protein (DUF1111 family)
LKIIPMHFSQPLPTRKNLLYGGLFALVVALSIGWSMFWFQIFPDLEKSPRAGGETTISNRSSKGFQIPSPGLSKAELALHTAGDVNFDAIFVTGPAELNAGLGPKFNNASCTACHVGNGRGMPEMGQALVRISLPSCWNQPIDPHQGVVPVPQIGAQIRDRALQGETADAKVTLDWQEHSGKYPDGTRYSLRQPRLTLTSTGVPLPAEIQTSLRVPPPVFGLGLLEAVPEAQMLKIADPEDRDRNGISGRINRVWDPMTKTTTVGKFGLKANTPNLMVQTAAAYFNDMGITNPLFPGANNASEVSQETLKASTFYAQSLGVPVRTQLDSDRVRQGERLFAQANCAACHRATLQTGASSVKALANQTIHPYTDLLLHDLGAGLADGRSDFLASGQEWRTSPLWGLGLTQAVLPYAGYLHDGRARSVEEAILWHGGEGQAAQQRFMAMGKADRQALLKFLNSL